MANFSNPASSLYPCKNATHTNSAINSLFNAYTSDISILNITNICYKQICSHTSICNHTHMYSGIYNHVYNPTLDKLEQSLYNNLQLLKKEKPKEIIFYSSSLRDLCERKTY